MLYARVRVHAGAAAIVLLLIDPSAALAQQATVSVRVAPFGWRSSTPLFALQIDESGARAGGLRLPTLTLTNTRSGPQLTNLALALPEVTIGRTAVSSRLGDQHLPSTFLSSPLSGSSVQWPLRGLSVSTSGATPWTLSVGQLDGKSYTGLPASDAAVGALAVSLAPHEKLTVSPRFLVPVGSGLDLQTSIGTAIRAEVLPHLSLVGDLGAADRARGGWAPLASAGLASRWRTTEVETSVLRGSPSPGTSGATTVGLLDRELVRGRVQALSGLTIAGLASRWRPANAHTPGTHLTSVAVAYDGQSYGQVAATRERQVASGQAVDTTRFEWRPPVLTGFAVRYVQTSETHGTGRRPATLIKIDLPSLTPRRTGSRVRLGAALTAAPHSDRPALASRVSGRVDIVERVTLTGETELRLAHEGGGQLLRTLHLGTNVGVMPQTVLQLRYAHRAGTPFSLNRSLEARISRTIDLTSW